MSESHTIPVATNDAASKPKCLRISGIPDSWSEDDLRWCLKTLDPNLRGNDFKLSLYPACHGSGQVCTLNLSQCTEYFQQVVPYKPFFASVQGQDFSIDCDFNGLTPLNTPPKEILADIVAVTGLAGHPYGSWKNRQSQRMWLQDFLPRDLPGVRIMTFGYGSRIEANKGMSRMLDYARFFVDRLYIARSSKSVWLVAILLKTLSHFYSAGTISSHYLHWPLSGWYPNYPGVFFFGTPHQGLRTEELEEMANDLISDPDDTIDLLRKLRAGSEFLESQSDDIADILDKMKSSQTGRYERSGEEVQSVASSAAFMHLRHEVRIPVQANHTDIVKFLSNSDSTYISLVTHLRDCVQSINVTHNEEMRPKKGETGDMEDLAFKLQTFGQLEEAGNTQRQALEVRTSIPRPKHRDTANAMHTLGLTLYHRCQVEEAEKLHRQVVELRTSILGPKHPETVDAMYNLGLTLYGRGQLEETEKIQRQVLEVRTSILGLQDPDTMRAMHNLGLTLYH
ncbi:10351_t:CDS:2, partial [Acaulospora colombiana]